MLYVMKGVVAIAAIVLAVNSVSLTSYITVIVLYNLEQTRHCWDVTAKSMSSDTNHMFSRQTLRLIID